ncbi:disease resistance protein RUN1-like [Eucalyptus grandis]|uniref:disease resistance protein RUN1-like n=1 Tax=Eucalyptus grandis TaxID=71139 RepID=UPI00192EDD02|nr:disease resistance protein RUN1-like [Eucalyptus grandis]
MLRSKKVLLLLDDTDDASQLDALMQKHEWFGKGSKIVITTKDRGILNVDETYKLTSMDFDHSLTLFSKHAFRRDYPLGQFISHSERVVDMCNGLPLALEVIGSLLSGKSEEEWDATLKELEESPQENVRKKLMINIEALNENQRKIFLDVACFSIGYGKRIVIHLWESCKFLPHQSLGILQQRSLIKIRDDNQLWMHDWLRDIGRTFIEEGSASAVKLSLVDNHFNSLIELDLSNTGNRELANSIGYMKKLKMLKLCNCPIRILPGDIGMLEKLEQLEVGEELTEILSDIGKLPILRKLVLAHCEIPTMPQLPESLITLTIDLYSMKRMSDLSNLLNLRNLKLHVGFEHPTKLEVDPSSWGIGRLRMLEVLDLYCRDIGTLSFDLVLLFKLKELHIQCPNLQCLPRLLTNLSYLDIKSCNRIKATNGFSNLKALSVLEISYCWKLTEIEGLEGLENLRTLKLHYLSLAKLPDLTSLKKLKVIHVSCCFELVEVLDCPESLETLEIEWCPKVQKWPDLSRLKNLKVPHQGKRERS